MMRSHKVRSLSCAVQESVRRVEVQQTGSEGERERGSERSVWKRRGGKGGWSESVRVCMCARVHVRMCARDPSLPW
jgi:hypothetical protein